MIHRPHVSLHLQMQTRGPEWRRSYVDQIHFTKANLVYLLGSFLTAHYGRFLPSLSYILATYWPIILMNPSHHPLCCFGTVSAAASLSRRESPRAMIIFGTSSEYEEAWAERRASDRLHSFKNSAPKSSNGILKGWKWSIVDTIHYHGLHTIGRFGGFALCSDAYSLRWFNKNMLYPYLWLGPGAWYIYRHFAIPRATPPVDSFGICQISPPDKTVFLTLCIDYLTSGYQWQQRVETCDQGHRTYVALSSGRHFHTAADESFWREIQTSLAVSGDMDCISRHPWAGSLTLTHARCSSNVICKPLWPHLPWTCTLHTTGTGPIQIWPLLLFTFQAPRGCARNVKTAKGSGPGAISLTTFPS